MQLSTGGGEVLLTAPGGSTKTYLGKKQESVSIKKSEENQQPPKGLRPHPPP
jgi:hypothetical protein